MFHSALWKLIRLKWRGSFRQLGRTLKTLRGLVQVGLIVLMIAYGLISMFFFGWLTSATPEAAALILDRMREFAAFGMFVFTTWALLFSTGDSAVYFTASEVAFLFPAPFSRRHLLTYKLIQSFSGLLLLSLMMSLVLARRWLMWAGGFIGLLLTLSFIQLLTMNVAFARQVLEAKTHVLIRRVLGYVISLWVLLAVTQMALQAPSTDLASLAVAFRNSRSGHWLLMPFDLFARMILPVDLLGFVVSTLFVLVIDAVLLTLSYRLDALSLEAALAVSEKLTARIKQIQAKGVWQIYSTATSQTARRRLPRLPFWGGLGPIIWQRLTTNLRTSMKLIWMLIVALLLASGLAYGLRAKAPEHPFAALGAGAGVMGYVSLFVSLTLQNEIERVGYLKSLPIRSVSVVLGELLGFVALLSGVQSLFFLVLACLLPDVAAWSLCAIVLTFPYNFLLFAIDKLVFYLYPTRLVKGAPGDFQNAGRQMFYMMLKMLLLFGSLTLVGIAVIPGAAIYRSAVAAVIPAAAVLVAECLALVPLLTYAFDRFDPSVDTPA